MRPILFLDVDGVINADATDDSRPATIDGITVVYRPSVVDWVNHLARDGVASVVWLTTWRPDHLPLLVEALGFDHFDQPRREPGSIASWDANWWKLGTLRAVLAGQETRRWAWLDDDIADATAEQLRLEFPAGLPYRVDSRPGLTDYDMAVVETWLRAR